MGIYGDSIGTGWRGISDRSKRWTSVTCTNLNLEEHNFSVDGLGFIRRRDTDVFPFHPLEMVINAQPQIALIALGQNDYGCIPERESELRGVIIQDMITLRDALPASQVLVVEPYWPSTLREPPKGRHLFDLHGECAQETGLPFIKGQRGIFGEDCLPYLYPEEGQLHPNDQGHAVLAATMTAALSPYAAHALLQQTSLTR
jgi:lysophospholipase L1-like esterase